MSKSRGIVVETPIYYGYKRPLKLVEGGFGYMGVLATNSEKTHVQCHICGKFFKVLGNHTNKDHKLNAEKYKKKFDLAATTALMGEATRNQRVATQITLTPEQMAKRIENFKKSHTASALRKRKKRLRGRKISLEQKNKDGRCPDQLIHKIREAAKRLGHTPGREEFRNMYNGYLGSVITTFGSWSRAVRIAELEVKTGGSTDKRYSDIQLLIMLQNFYKEYGRTPRYSDFKRGIMPSPPTYQSRFGTIANARKLAGVPNLVKVQTGPNSWEYLEESK